MQWIPIFLVSRDICNLIVWIWFCVHKGIHWGSFLRWVLEFLPFDLYCKSIPIVLTCMSCVSLHFFSSSSFYRLLFCLWIWFFRFFILIMNLNWLGQRPLLSLWSKYWRILTSFFWNWTILVAINDLSFYSSMSFSEAVLQVLSGAVPFCPNPYSSSLNKFPIKSYLKRRKQRGLWNIRSRVDHNCKRIYGVQKVRGISHGNTAINQSRFLNCQCQPVDSVSETVGDNGNGSWFKDPTKQVSPIHSGESKKVLNFEDVQPLKNDKEVFTTNGVMCKDMQYDNSKISVEDEAWNLLRESMVYYCGSPIGTIAALDTSSSSVLNYDQVFIRDFIPSGIAFLLKGEYDIVRNFILHTLQLQVYTCSNFFFFIFLLQSIIYIWLRHLRSFLLLLSFFLDMD